MVYNFKPKGVCTRDIRIDLDDTMGVVNGVEFNGGCQGNLIGLSVLSKGLPIDSVIEKLKGIPCGGKATSCPDQLARALEQYKQAK